MKRTKSQLRNYPLLLLFILVIISACSVDDSTIEKSSSEELSQKYKIEYITKLFESYGWHVDTTIEVEERNRKILGMDERSIQLFLEKWSSQCSEIKIDTTSFVEINETPILNSADVKYVYIHGEHSSYLFNSQTSMTLVYITYGEYVSIHNSTVNAGNGIEWIPSEGKSLFKYEEETSKKRIFKVYQHGVIRYNCFYNFNFIMTGRVEMNLQNGLMTRGEVDGFHQLKNN